MCCCRAVLCVSRNQRDSEKDDHEFWEEASRICEESGKEHLPETNGKEKEFTTQLLLLLLIVRKGDRESECEADAFHPRLRKLFPLLLLVILLVTTLRPYTIISVFVNSPSFPAHSLFYFFNLISSRAPSFRSSHHSSSACNMRKIRFRTSASSASLKRSPNIWTGEQSTITKVRSACTFNSGSWHLLVCGPLSLSLSLSLSLLSKF